jgi:hypothetical protein
MQRGEKRLSLLACTRGATLGEYIVVVGVVALAAIAGFRAFGTKVYSKVTTAGGDVQTLSPMKEGSNYCFAAGTLVATPAGLRPIEQIHAGDAVLSEDEESRAVVVSRAAATFVTPDAPLVEVRVREQAEPIRATPGHRFFTADRGWVEAQWLAPDEALLAATGRTLHVDGVTRLGARETVYNFEVERTHTYFVGTEAAWVHNPTEDCNGNPIGSPTPPPTPPGRAPGGSSGSGGSSSGSGPPPSFTPPSSGAAPPAATNPAISGHGSWNPSDGFFIVPPGTSIEMPTWHNVPISDAYGNAVETGRPVSSTRYPEAGGAHIYGPGSLMPNYTVDKPTGLNIKPHPTLGPPTTVKKPTLLSTLVGPNQGNRKWAACMTDTCLDQYGPKDPKTKKRPYEDVPAYPPKGSQPTGFPTIPNKKGQKVPLAPPAGSTTYPKPKKQKTSHPPGPTP